MSKKETRLQIKNISKEYYGNKVLKEISFDVGTGEIVSLVGENGAGKSTLMNILFGMPVIHVTGGYDGELIFNDQLVLLKTPEEAMKLGIGMVHQEFMLLPGFTITENIKLNREITKPSLLSRFVGKSMEWLDMDTMRSDSRKAMDAMGLTIDEMLPIKGLPVGFMQFIEIAREIDKENTKLLVLDEPTAVLTESEAKRLLEVMRMLAARGISILFISHRLDEVISISDKIIVLRDGEQIAVTTPAETSIERLAELMVGRKIEASQIKGRPLEKLLKEEILEIEDLRVEMPGESVCGINLKVHRGEILGIAGLAGQGKIGVANGVMGLYSSTGKVRMNNSDLPLNNARAVLNRGLAFVSEDRRGVGLLLDDPIDFNIAATATQVLGKFIDAGGGRLLDKKLMREHAWKILKDLDIRCTGPEQLTRRLSGGNQQKVCIARALTLKPELLFVSEPTRGIDIGAKTLILDLLVKLNREQGLTVVVTSSELAELRSICDRIAIVYEGKLEGILLPTDSDRDFGLMMAGEYSRVKEAV